MRKLKLNKALKQSSEKASRPLATCICKTMIIRNIINLVALCYFSFFASVSLADPDKKYQECLSNKDNYTTAGMTNCTNEAAKQWDSELNKVYKELLSKLTPEGIQSLRAAQRQWLKFRDKEYQFISDMYDRREFQGTMYIPVKAKELLTVTKRRALELQGYLNAHK